MITIYGIRGMNVIRLRAALLKKNLPFIHVDVNLRQKSSEFCQLTPAETLPVLREGEVIVADSIAGIDYLDHTYPETYNMLGVSAKERAHILSVIWCMDRISKFLTPLYQQDLEQLRKSGQSFRAVTYDQQQKEDLQNDILYRLEKVQGYRQGKYFAGRYTAADASMVGLLMGLKKLSIYIGSWDAWLDEMLKDPMIQAIIPSPDEQGVRKI